ALAMPFFLSFVLALICFIQLTVTELALHHAVTETSKQLAASAYPVELLAVEARDRYQESQLGQTVDQWTERIRTARSKLLQGETWVEDYSAFIPEWLVQLVGWEKTKREQAEQLAVQQYEAFIEEQIKPL